jgi:putative transposase
VKSQIYQLLRQREGVEVLELNVPADHVHLLLWIPPKYAVSEIMGFLKGKLALRLFERFPQLGRKDWGRHLWSRGYCVSTVGIDEEMIRHYVRWQASQERRAEQQQGKLFDEYRVKGTTAPSKAVILHATAWGGGS